MKKRTLLILMGLCALVLSSCGALPTLPPLDSTVTIRTPQATLGPRLITATSQVVVMTVTPTAAVTSVPTATKEPVKSSTPTPRPATATLAASATPALTATRTPTRTPPPSLTPTALPFSLQLMNPYYLQNFTHDDVGCDWLGVAGQIFNAEGQVQKDIVIRAGGMINGKPVVEEMTMPLAEPGVDLAYGPGGFELTLASSLAATESQVWIQLYGLGGDALSERVFLTTYNDCQKNLILLNFVEKK